MSADKLGNLLAELCISANVGIIGRAAVHPAPNVSIAHSLIEVAKLDLASVPVEEIVCRDADNLPAVLQSEQVKNRHL